MDKKPTNKNIDDVFRDSIDNLETEPSEGFWVKASEDSLFRNNLNNRQSINKWKAVAAVLAFALVSLSIYVVYIQKQVRGLNKEITAVKNTNSASSANDKVSAVVLSNNPSVTSVQNIQPIATTGNNPDRKKINSVGTGNEGTPNPSGLSRKGISNTRTAFLDSHTLAANSNNAASVNETVMNKTNAEIESANKPGNEIAALNGIRINSFAPEENNILAAIDQPNDYVKPAKKQSKFAVSLFYEPYLSDELFEKDGADNTVVNNSVVSSEEEVNPFKLGARVEYAASKHVSFITGCNFYNVNISFKPTTIFAEQQANGDVGYTFQTAAGTVNCPYGNAKPNVGDAIIVKGTYTTNYINVPLFVKYRMQLGERFNIYAVGGAEVNMVAYRSVNMHWQDTRWNEGEAKEGISNSSKVYCSLYMAPGISYKICNICSVYVEPSLQESACFISESGITKNSSMFLGIGGGVTCSL